MLITYCLVHPQTLSKKNTLFLNSNTHVLLNSDNSHPVFITCQTVRRGCLRRKAHRGWMGRGPSGRGWTNLPLTPCCSLGGILVLCASVSPLRIQMTSSLVTFQGKRVQKAPLSPGICLRSVFSPKRFGIGVFYQHFL